MPRRLSTSFATSARPSPCGPARVSTGSPPHLGRRGKLLGGVVGAVFLFAASAARAMTGPFLWEEAVCAADALVEIEVTLSPSAAVDARGGRAAITQVLWNRYPKKRPRVRLGAGLPDRRPLVLELRANAAATPADPAHAQILALEAQAVNAGRYRVRQLLSYSPAHGWSAVDGVVTFSLEPWITHPAHEAWLKKVRALIAERDRLDAEGRRPPFCQDIEREE